MITLFGEIDKNDLRYVRERYGEPRFGIPAPSIKDGEKYLKINPHVSRFFYPNGKITDVFHVKPIYYVTPTGQWRPLYEIANHYGNKRGMVLKEGWENKIDFGYLAWYIRRLEVMKSQYGVAVSYPQTYAGIELNPTKIPVLLNATLTAYPDPDPETTTIDGIIDYFDSAGVTWATMHDATDAAGVYASDTPRGFMIASHTDTSRWTRLRRFVCLFDTSSLTSGASISATTLSLYGYAKDDGLSITPDLNIYTSTPGSNFALATADYDNFGTVAQSDTAVTYANFSSVAYNDFVFNATGIGNISKTSISKFGARNANYDVANIEPAWSSNVSSNLNLENAEYAETTRDPKLVVTYTLLAVSYINLLTLNVG